MSGMQTVPPVISIVKHATLQLLNGTRHAIVQEAVNPKRRLNWRLCEFIQGRYCDIMDYCLLP